MPAYRLLWLSALLLCKLLLAAFASSCGLAVCQSLGQSLYVLAVMLAASWTVMLVLDNVHSV